MKLLSICLPTYNRSLFLINQLEFLQRELDGFEDLVDLYVSDNYSEISHTTKLKEYHQLNPFFDLAVQTYNKGLIGNIYELLGKVNSEYVWFVGDDDILQHGVISTLIRILTEKNDLNLIFFNHKGFVGSENNIVGHFDMLDYEGEISEGKAALIELFYANTTALMFITACVYKVSVLEQNFYRVHRQKLIEDPLLFSFVLASLGKIYLVKEVYILDRYRNASWQTESQKIFGWGVAFALSTLSTYSFSRKEIKKLIFIYYMNFRASYLRLLFLSPLSIKLRIISILRFSNIQLLYSSFKLIFSHAKIRLKTIFTE